MSTEFEPEVSLSLSDIRKVIDDVRIRELVAECDAQGGDIGGCVEDRLLERLTELFGEGAPGEEILEPVLMRQWLEADPAPGDDEKCRPCALPVTVQWYSDELQARNRRDLADRLEKTALSADPLTTAEEMDYIKSAVDEDTRRRLLDFDASTQVNS